MNGSARLTRVDTFRADPAVPVDWFRVSGFDYVGSGFDRGHMVPNADRDKETSIPINQATFLMTNMIPQSPANNQGPWANLEGIFKDALDLAMRSTSSRVGQERVAPAAAGRDQHYRRRQCDCSSSNLEGRANNPEGQRRRCVARELFNQDTRRHHAELQASGTNPWETYITTVDAVESLTGYDFFSNLPDAVENCVEAGTNGTNTPATANQSATTPEDTAVEITLQAVRPDADPLTFSIVTGPTNGSLGSIGAPSCIDFRMHRNRYIHAGFEL